MKKALKLLLILPLITLTSCELDFGNKNSNPTNSVSSSVSINVPSPSSILPSPSTNIEETRVGYHLYDSNLSPYGKLIAPDYEFKFKLDEPTRVVSNLDELRKICDYEAFYQNSSFDVTLSPNYVYTSPTKNFEEEINRLYWHNELINGVIGLIAEKKNESTIHFEYLNYDYGKKSAIDTYQTTNLQDALFRENDFSSLNENIKFVSDEMEKKCEVYNSQQLFYAVEHGYTPLLVPGSEAEDIYLQAKKLLRKIIKPEMSEYEKVYAIYSYIVNMCVYDYDAAELADGGDNKNLPDEGCAYYDAFFLEGFFKNRRVVCDGFAKAYSLLCRMVGIENFRAIGGNGDYSTRVVPGHAYNYVKVDNQWYLSCSTWGNLRLWYNFGYYELTSYNYFLTRKSVMYLYESTLWANIAMDQHFDYYANTHMESNDGTSNLIIESIDDVNILFSTLNSLTRPFGICIYINEENEDVINMIYTQSAQNDYQIYPSSNSQLFIVHF